MVRQRAYTLGALIAHIWGGMRRSLGLFAIEGKRRMIYGGRKHVCSVCGNLSRRFVSLRKIAGGILVRSVLIDGKVVGPENYEFLNIENFACSVCHAPDKARLMAWFLETEGFERLKKTGLPVLHFDPEPGMVRYLTRSYFDYLPTSWPEKLFSNSFDITDLSGIEGEIGGFICSHILEHVESDSVAAEQLFRALAPGGFGIVLVPIIRSLEENWEVAGPLSEDDRWRFFGQGDHVRIYSKPGLRSVLEEAGFGVRELGVDYFGDAVFQKLALSKSSVLYIVEKNQEG